MSQTLTPLTQALDFVSARRAANLSDETMQVLLTVSIGGAATRQQLAEACAINQTTLPRYLSSLVASGHLEKSGGTGDKREVFFRLSPHGERLVASLLKHFPPCQMAI